MEIVVSGGTFGDSQGSPTALPNAAPLHGGYFGGLTAAAPVACEQGPDFHACRALASCLRTWGRLVEYQRQGALPFVLPSGGIFRETFTTVDLSNGSTVSSITPTIGIRRSELPAQYGRSDYVIVAGRLFLVREVQKDGEVGAKVFLHEVFA